MSRSEHAQPLKLATTAAIGCMLVLVAGCRFSTNPGDMIVEPDAGSAQEPAGRAAQEDETGPAPTRASTGTSVVVDAGSELSRDAGAEDLQDSGKPSAQRPQSAGSAAPAPAPSAGSAAPATPPAPAGSAAPVSPPTAAGSPALTDAGTISAPALDASAPALPSASDAQCSAELADCLVRNPLGYAECLRTNQESGCPEPDSGVPTMSPVTAEDGSPLSQACQAELATCIMRLPTPENAASCTEKARKCK